MDIVFDILLINEKQELGNCSQWHICQTQSGWDRESKLFVAADYIYASVSTDTRRTDTQGTIIQLEVVAMILIRASTRQSHLGSDCTKTC